MVTHTYLWGEFQFREKKWDYNLQFNYKQTFAHHTEKVVLRSSLKLIWWERQEFIEKEYLGA